MEGQTQGTRQRAALFIDRLRRYASSPRAVLRTLRLASQARIVRRSPLFDREWYLRQNPDLAAVGEDPALHYLFAGAPAGNDPGPGFCGEEYLSLNPDARASGLNPLVHYERVGRKRGLRISRLQSLLPNGRAAPDWRFPSLEEHQAALSKTAEALRVRLSSGGKAKVLFLVADEAVFPARPLFDAMRKDPRFEAAVSRIPPPGTPNAQDADPVADFKADIVCYPRIYSDAPFRCCPRWAVGAGFLPIYANYGYPCTRFAAPVLAMENYAYCWKVFFESEAALEEYAKVSPIGGANGVVTGSIKMDALATMDAEQGGMGQPSGAPQSASKPRKRVLLAPHHSIEGGSNDILSLSNFMRFADFFAELPARFPDIDFLFRPHPFLFQVLARPKFWGKDRCDAWRKRFLSHPNAAWSEMGDPVRDFAASDAIVQDCASFLADWMFTGKPCCYMLHGEEDAKAKFNAIGRECLKRCSVACDEAAIGKFLRNVVLEGCDPMAAEREAFRRKIAVNWPHAAEAALAAIVRDLFFNENAILQR